MPKKSKQKFKYLANEKNFSDEIISIFHHFSRAIIEENNNKKILEDDSPPLIAFQLFLNYYNAALQA